MICKDSIEEKILKLQQRKKTLSKDLISEDTSFIGKLSKECGVFVWIKCISLAGEPFLSSLKIENYIFDFQG